MSKIVKNKDGTTSIVGGFSTKNAGDVNLLKGIIKEKLGLREEGD